MEHKPLTSLAISVCSGFPWFAMVYQLCLLSLISRSRLLRQVVLGLPLFRLPWWFYRKACRIMLPSSFLRIYPIRVNFHFMILSGGRSWLVRSHKSWLLIRFDHHILMILRRHLLMNDQTGLVCLLLLFFFVVRQVSAPYNTDFTLVVRYTAHIYRTCHGHHRFWEPELGIPSTNQC